MDPLKPTTEHLINIQDEKHQEKKITKEQEQILFQAHLANILIFGAWTLTPEQQALQNKLQIEYLKNLKPWEEVGVWLEGCMPYHNWIVTENDWEIVKVKARCWLNKKRKEGIRSFSTQDWYSKGFIFTKDDWWDSEKLKFFIVTPKDFTVESTRWMPKELVDEIYELYKQAGDPKTCYDLVNALKLKKIQDEWKDTIMRKASQ